MNGQSISREAVHCYECHDKTDKRCSYCLLPLCEEHGKWVTPWFTSRQVMVCAPCQERLRETAQEEERFELAAQVLHHGSAFTLMHEQL